MKAKLDAGRSLLYQTARYVDIYKALEDIQRDRKLESEERLELKKYSRLADAFTPLAKGMNSEYANQNAYDAISIHGGSGFIMEYKSQRLYRDARIFSIYEGTTQLQVVAALRYISNGTYLGIMNDMLEACCNLDNYVAAPSEATAAIEALLPLRHRVATMIELYEQSLNYVKGAENQEVTDFLARRLYDMTCEIVMSLLILDDAVRARLQGEEELAATFFKSANVYVRMAEEDVIGKCAYIKSFIQEDLVNFRAK